MIITYIERNKCYDPLNRKIINVFIKAIYENINLILQFEKLGMCDIDENLRCEKKELDEAYQHISHIIFLILNSSLSK